MPKPTLQVSFIGFGEVAAKIQTMLNEAGETQSSGTRVGGEMIMTDVKASRPGQGVPRDKGTLGNSGRVSGPDNKGRVALTFGGASAPYALFQHEVTKLLHKLGEARYLIRGVERFIADGGPAKTQKRIMDTLIKSAKSVTKKGGARKRPFA